MENIPQKLYHTHRLHAISILAKLIEIEEKIVFKEKNYVENDTFIDLLLCKIN